MHLNQNNDIDELLKTSKEGTEKRLKKQIKIKDSNVPEELMSLYHRAGPDGKFFISHANSLNQALAFFPLAQIFRDGMAPTLSMRSRQRKEATPQ